jgi:hypothetical protein
MIERGTFRRSRAYVAHLLPFEEWLNDPEVRGHSPSRAVTNRLPGRSQRHPSSDRSCVRRGFHHPGGLEVLSVTRGG